MINNIFNIEYGSLARKKVSKYIYIKGTKYKIDLVDEMRSALEIDVKNRVIKFFKGLSEDELSACINYALVYVYFYELGLPYYHDATFLDCLLDINSELPYKNNQIIKIVKENKGRK